MKSPLLKLKTLAHIPLDDMADVLCDAGYVVLALDEWLG